MATLGLRPPQPQVLTLETLGGFGVGARNWAGGLGTPKIAEPEAEQAAKQAKSTSKFWNQLVEICQHGASTSKFKSSFLTC